MKEIKMKTHKILTKDDFAKHNNKKYKSLLDETEDLVGVTNYIQNQLPKDSKAKRWFGLIGQIFAEFKV